VFFLTGLTGFTGHFLSTDYTDFMIKDIFWPRIITNKHKLFFSPRKSRKTQKGLNAVIFHHQETKGHEGFKHRLNDLIFFNARDAKDAEGKSPELHRIFHHENHEIHKRG
jgi:hypothetical protein